MNRKFKKSFRSLGILIVPQLSNKKIKYKDARVLSDGLMEQIVLSILYSLTYGTIQSHLTIPNEILNLSLMKL